MSNSNCSFQVNTLKGYNFVLGGNDAEMEVIKVLLSQAGVAFSQPNTGWGAPPIDFMEIAFHSIPIFVECEPAADTLPEVGSNSQQGRVGTLIPMVIDHHGARSGEPASVMQVLNFLESKGVRISDSLRRWCELIGANDSGYIPAMEKMGATPVEITQIRLLDRQAQGITPEHEAEAERVLSIPPEIKEGVRILHAKYSKCSPVTDRLYQSGWRGGILIIAEDGEVNFFGDGAICARLQSNLGGWSGGSGLGKEGGNAFWGGNFSEEAVRGVLNI